MSYNDKLDPEDQIGMEEWIAAHIFDYPYQGECEGVDEDDAMIMGRTILAKVLTRFRPDLIVDGFWQFGDGNVANWSDDED